MTSPTDPTPRYAVRRRRAFISRRKPPQSPLARSTLINILSDKLLRYKGTADRQSPPLDKIIVHRGKNRICRTELIAEVIPVNLPARVASSVTTVSESWSPTASELSYVGIVDRNVAERISYRKTAGIAKRYFFQFGPFEYHFHCVVMMYTMFQSTVTVK